MDGLPGEYTARARGSGLVGAWMWLVLFAACDSPGGGPQAIAPDGVGDVITDAASVAETSDTLGAAEATPETSPAETVDTTADTAADTSAPDTGPVSVCALGCIPISTETAPTGVVFRQYTTAPRPALKGGPAPQGEWVLDAVDIYSQGTFADGITVTLADRGATAGRVAFGGDAMAMALDLDLQVTVTAFGSTGSDGARSRVAVGGCHEVVGTRIVGDLGDCAEGFETSGSAPASLDYELTGVDLAVGVSITREQLIALFPADQREAADFAITGPLYLVARFVSP